MSESKTIERGKTFIQKIRELDPKVEVYLNMDSPQEVLLCLSTGELICVSLRGEGSVSYFPKPEIFEDEVFCELEEVEDEVEAEKFFHEVRENGL